MKRYIYIIIGIVVVAIIAILILLFIKNKSVSNPAGTSSTTTGSLPAVGSQTNPNNTSGTVTQNNTPSTVISLGSQTSGSSGTGQVSVNSFGVLSNDHILDYFVDASNNITAIQPTGAVISISKGQTSTVNSSTINNIISASFSYDGTKILVNSGDPTNPQSAVFDTTAHAWTSLPNGIQSPQWSSTNYQVAYLSVVGAGKEALSIINVASIKSGIATLITLNANDMNLQWPTKTQFILSDKPTSYIDGSAWLFSSANSSLTPIIYENTGLESIWSRTTSTLGLVFTDGSSGQNRTLQLEAPTGSTLQTLNFLTLPSKCVFNPEKTATSTTSTAYIALYCGIPRNSSAFSSANLPDDYETMALLTSDDIYKINTTSGETQVVWSDKSQNIDTSDLKVFNNTLFFTNRYDQKLYGLIFQQ